MKASFSSFGPTADGRIKPDVAAQGQSVYLAVPGGGYAFSNGTSFSSPLVAGVVAQILQVNPNLGPVEVRDLLRETASQADAPDNRLGWGIVNADAAIQEAERRATAIEDLPERLTLVRPYPNPFRSETRFEVQTREAAGPARLSIYNLLGQRVQVPFDGFLPAGRNRLPFRASGLPAGVYYFVFETENTVETGTVVLVR